MRELNVTVLSSLSAHHVMEDFHFWCGTTSQNFYAKWQGGTNL
jgi:hypothetical protein